MKSFYFLSIIILFLATPTSTIKADELEEAPTEDFENEVSLKAEPINKRNVLSYRAYLISTYRYQHIKDESAISDIRSAQASLNGELILKPREDLTFKTDVESQFTTITQDSNTNSSNAKDFVRLNEGFVDYAPSNSVSALIGKYRRVFGPGLFYNPMDRHNPKSFLPGTPTQREGTYIAQVTLKPEIKNSAVNDIAITAAYIPSYFQNESGLPIKHKKFSTVSITGPTREEKKYEGDYAGGFLRLYGNLASSDANLVIYFTEDQWQYGASWSRFFSDWFESHFELLHYKKSHLGQNEKAENGFFDWMYGFRFEPSDDYGWNIEHLNLDDHPKKVPIDPAKKLEFLNILLNETQNSGLILPLKQFFFSSAYIRNIKDRFGLMLNTVINPENKIYFWMLRSEATVGDTAKLAFSPTYVSRESKLNELIPFDWGAVLEVTVNF